MRKPLAWIVCAALFMPAFSLADETKAVDSFVLDMKVPGSKAVRTIVVRCTRGCEWTEKAIECMGGRKACHAVIASSNVVDSIDQLRRHSVEPRPIAGSVCLGVQTLSDPPPHMDSSRCEETVNERGDTGMACQAIEVPAPRTRVLIRDVLADSPAGQAGFKTGDVLVTFNGVPPQGRMDLVEAILRGVAGQPYEAVLTRQGIRVTARGRFGIVMSDETCAVATEKLLRGPALTAQDLEPAPFLVEFDGDISGIEVNCVQGCYWHAGPIPCEGNCAVTYDQNDFAGLSLLEATDTPPDH
jgi:hypothetical protein